MAQQTSRNATLLRYVRDGVTLGLLLGVAAQLLLGMANPTQDLTKYLPALSACGVLWAWLRYESKTSRRFIFALAEVALAEVSAVQPDPPSGVWGGFWEQGRMGRQAMSPLELRFEAGHVYGAGVDCVGPFTFEGSFGGGEVRLLKHYLRRHTVVYVGNFDPAGHVCGRWSIGGWLTGPFELWPQPAG